MTDSEKRVLGTPAGAGYEQDVQWLTNGWEWLEANPDHPRHDEFEEAWIQGLRRYEKTYTIWLEAMQ